MSLIAATALWITATVFVIAILPTEPVLPPDIAEIISFIFAAMNDWGTVLPVASMLTVATLIFAIEIGVMTYHLTMRVFALIKS